MELKDGEVELVNERDGPPIDAKPGDRYGAYILGADGWWVLCPEKPVPTTPPPPEHARP